MFPDDEAAQRQARLILQDEYARLQTRGPEKYAPSLLAQKVLRAFEKSITERATCAFMVWALVGLDDIDENMSQRRAAAVVSEYANSKHGTKFFQRTEKGLEISSKALTGDQASIKKIFRKHRPVAHIIAARQAMSDHRKPQNDFGSPVRFEQHFLSTVLYYQKRLSKAEGFNSWNSWRVEIDPASEVELLPEPWLPKQETMDKILGPWLAAGKPIG